MNTLKNSLSKAVNQFIGHICVTACRADLIRLLNLFRNKGVKFWGFEETEKEVSFKLGLFGCDSALEYAKEANIQLVVTRRVGLPFFTYRYRKRAGLLVGMILGFALVLASSLFVWDIEITGNNLISNRRIISTLHKNGLSVGAFIPKINVHSVEESTILSLPDLSSVAITVNGTHIAVDVIERARPPETEKQLGLGVSSIYADKEGVIVSVVAESGKVLVNNGDVVAKGSVLVSGVYNGYTGMQIAVRSKATVMAHTRNTFCVSVPFVQSERKYTGKSVTKKTASVLGHNFELYFGAMIPYDKFDGYTEESEYKLFGFIRTPITVTSFTAREYETVKTRIGEELALKKAIAEFDSHLEEIKHGDVVEKSYSYFIDKEADCLTLTGSYILLEDIGKEMPHQISESP